MAIVEKKIIIESKNGALPDVEHIENAIRQAGLEPVRWGVVEFSDGKFTILANGVEA